MKYFMVLAALLVLTTACKTLEEMEGDYTITTLNAKIVTEKGMTLQLSLNEDGSHQMSGKSTCNRYFGSFTVDGDQLTMSGIGATKMFCQEGRELESEHMKAYGETTAYTYEGDQLTLKDKEGKTIITATKNK